MRNESKFLLLAIFLPFLVITNQSAFASVNVATPIISLSTHKAISFNHAGELSTSAGWATPEPGGTWSTSNISSIRIALPKFGKTAIISFTSQANVSSKNAKVTLKILANSSVVSIITYLNNNASNRAVRAFTIPVSAVHSNFSNIPLTLQIVGAASPKSLGLSKDVRNLGVFLINMSVKSLN